MIDVSSEEYDCFDMTATNRFRRTKSMTNIDFAQTVESIARLDSDEEVNPFEREDDFEVPK